MEELTDMQANVLAYIVSFRKENQTPPTRLEISENFGWSSPNSAQEHLERLEKKGYIQLRGKARGIFVLRESEVA